MYVFETTVLAHRDYLILHFDLCYTEQYSVLSMVRQCLILNLHETFSRSCFRYGHSVLLHYGLQQPEENDNM